MGGGRVGGLGEGRRPGRRKGQTRKLKNHGEGLSYLLAPSRVIPVFPPLLSLHVWGDLEARMWLVGISEVKET